MTCREKLAQEHPDNIGNRWLGGCAGCPHDYGYLAKPEYCNFGQGAATICTECWDREISNAEPSEQPLTWDKVFGMIDDSMRKRDREVHLFFNPNTGLSLNFYPWPNDSSDPNEKKE